MTRSEFLKEKVKWAKGMLSKPTYITPNGKNSHDLAREEMNIAIEELYNMQLDGLYDANGSFVSYGEEK